MINISKFVVLGALEALETAGGYDIIRYLEEKMIDRWTNVKKGSIYNALKTLTKSGDIKEVDRVKKGLFPTMTLYTITTQGRKSFDQMQEEAFCGLYPLYLGFKLALKFNQRRTPTEICQYGEKAITIIDQQLAGMENYLASLSSPQRREMDAFFIEHDRMLLKTEKRWIEMAMAREQGKTTP